MLICAPLSSHQYRSQTGASPRRNWVWLFLLFSVTAGAECRPQAPHQIVDNVIARVIAQLHHIDPAEADADKVTRELFEAELSPHLAYTLIARWIGGQQWITMPAAEREEMVTLIQSHVVGVYASLLTSGRGASITVAEYSEVGKKSARVAAELVLENGSRSALEFRLLDDAGQWKLFDLYADGLSFARTLKAELGPVVSAGGINGLREYMARHRKP